MNILFYVILPFLGMLALIYFLAIRPGRTSSSQGKQEEEEKEKTTEDPVEVLLYDSSKPMAKDGWESIILSSQVVAGIKTEYGNLGRLWDEDGKKLPHINKYFIEGSDTPHYRPVEKLMAETRDNPPEDVHGALDQEAVAVWYSVKTPDSFMQKWGSLLLYAAVAIFILFIWSVSLVK